MQITHNFNISEFGCSCGCDMPKSVKLDVIKLAFQLQMIRNEINKPIKINSAYRCAEHNKSIGGVPNSQHLLGKAADIRVRGVSTKELSDLINRMTNDGDILQGGIGIYKTFVHYDIRKTKARWDYR